MGVFQRRDSKFWYCWLEGATRPRVNTGILIGDTADDRKKNRLLAEQIYHKLMTDRALRRFGLPLDLPSRTFLQHRTWYAAHVSAHKRGVERELSILRVLGSSLDRLELADIDRDTVREWRTRRLAQVSVSTVSREEALLRHVLSTAVPTYLERNPLTGLTSLRVPGVDTRILTREEEQRLLEVTKDLEDRAVIITALDTLLRLSNVATLTRQQDHGTYLYSDTKVGAVKIPISSRLRLALNAVRKRGPYYFPSYAQVSQAKVRHMFHAVCKKADVRVGRQTNGVTFHSLRHTGASRMLEAGIDVKTVMEIGGWRNLAVLERYLHPTDARKRAAVEAISQPAPRPQTTRSRKSA